MYKGTASSEQTFPSPRHSAATEPNPHNWEGEHPQDFLSSEHIQETGKHTETIKKEKIPDHALTVHNLNGRMEPGLLGKANQYWNYCH